MTGQLRTTLEDHADELDPLDLDLDAIVRDGDRRRRRRRVTWAGGVAAAAVVAIVATAVGGHLRSSSPPQLTNVGADALIYAVGDVVHVGGEQIDVGHPVHSLVQTASGMVFTDGRRRVYEADGDLRQVIGHVSTTDSTLTVDDAGTTVAWIDGDHLLVFQPALDRTSTAAVHPESFKDHASVRAVTADAVWYWDGRQLMTYNLSSGTTAPVGGRFTSDTLQDVSAGQMLVNIPEGDGANTMAVVPVGSAPRGQGEVADIHSGDLSPDGRHWFTEDSDQFAVFDSTTGARQDPHHDGFGFASPYKWIDDDTIAAIALPRIKDADSEPTSLLSCRVSTNTCSVTAKDIGDYSQVALPVGISTLGR